MVYFNVSKLKCVYHSITTYRVKTTFINVGIERECPFRIQCVGTFANGSQSLYEFAFKIASKYNLHNHSAYISKIFEKMHRIIV